MTKQEYYELLVQTSASGGFPCVNEKGFCMYRGPDNKKCAVGLIIPDEKYDPSIEKQTADCGYVSIRVNFPDGMSRDDLAIVQKCHDDMASKCDRSTGWVRFVPPWDHEKFVRELDDSGVFV